MDAAADSTSGTAAESTAGSGAASLALAEAEPEAEAEADAESEAEDASDAGCANARRAEAAGTAKMTRKNAQRDSRSHTRAACVTLARLFGGHTLVKGVVATTRPPR
jgi:membrane protein involved in colicin uptake